MPFLFITACVFALITLAAIAGAILGPDEARPGAGLVAIGTGVVAIGALIWSCIFVVPMQQIGIPVTYGKPGPAVANGFHTKAPWTEIAKMDGTVQYLRHEGDARSDVRLANQSGARIQNTIGWRIKTDAADRLLRDHKKFENIEGAVVGPAAANALNDAFRTYDPITQAAGKAVPLSDIAKQVQATMNKTIGDRIEVVSVTIPKVDFDDATQKRIDQLQQEVGNTRIAEQRKKTATAEAQANRILAGSVSNNPGVLTSKCLDQQGEMIDKGQPIPAGFSCFPGGGTPVIADATTPQTQPAK